MAKWIEKKVTSDGHKLIAKAQVGIKIRFTKVVVGDGIHFQDGEIVNLDRILNPRQNAEIKEVKAIGTNTVCIKSVISNLDLKQGYFIKELGIMAVAEDEPEKEVLYCIAITEEGKHDYWPEYEQTVLSIPISMSVATGDSSHVSISVINTFEAIEIGYDNTKSKLLAVNLQEAVDELSCCNLIDAVIYHNLDTYPNAVVFEIINGYGQSYGSCGYGGSDFKREIKTRVVIKDRNTIQLLTETEYSGTPEVERISAHEYILNFEKARLFVTIITNYNDKKLHLDIQNLTVKLNEVDRNSTTRDIQLDANTKNLSDKLFETNRNLNLKDADLEEEIRNLKSKMSSFSHLYDEEIESLRRTHLIDSAIYHNLGAYPMIIVYEAVGGYGTSGYGTEKYGSVHSHVEVKSRVIPIDRNTIKISTEKRYKGTPKIQRLNRNEFQIVYPDNITLFVQLFVLSTSQPAVVNAAKAVTSFNGRAGDVVMDKTDVIGFIDNALLERVEIDDGDL